MLKALLSNRDGSICAREQALFNIGLKCLPSGLYARAVESILFLLDHVLFKRLIAAHWFVIHSATKLGF